MSDATLGATGRSDSSGRHAVSLAHLANAGTIDAPDPFAARDGWPTPKSGGNRNSRKAMVLNTDHPSATSLEQMAELAIGELPREFADVDELTPQARRVYGRAQWPTPFASDPAGSESLPDGTTATGQRPDGKKAQVGLNNAVKMWPSPNACNADGRGEQSVETWLTRFDRTLNEKGIRNGMPLNVAVQMEGHWPLERASDGAKGGPNQRGSKGDRMLPSAVISQESATLPTPGASDAKGVKRHKGGNPSLTAAAQQPMWPTPNSAKAGNDVTLTCSGDGRAQPNLLGWAVAEAEQSALAIQPTPNARDHKGSPSGAWAEQASLPRAVEQSVSAIRPIPTVNDARNATAMPSQEGRHSPGLATRASWSTPTQAVGLGGPGNGGRDGGENLRTQVGGRLSWRWVNSLQGLPDGWLDEDMEVSEEARIACCMNPRWPAPPGPQHPWEYPRLATGEKGRVQRLKSLGNCVVPAQAYVIFKAIAEIEEEESA